MQTRMMGTKIIYLLPTLLIAISVMDNVYCQKSLSSLPCAKNTRAGRIVGGADAKRRETPYIISLTRRGGHFCGGTILNENWIVTAGHCVCDGFNKVFKPTRIRGLIGLYKHSDFQKNAEGNTVAEPFEVAFQRIIVHPNYDCTKPQNDIALLQMAKPIRFSDFVKPMCIAMDDKDETYEGTLATVSGWGWTHENHEVGIRPDILQKASVLIWNNKKCQQSFQERGKRNEIGSTQMCAGYDKGGIDSCWADSGGPLITSDNLLVGVVSTGVGCGRPGLPGIYTRISKYIGWIEQTMNT